MDDDSILSRHEKDILILTMEIIKLEKVLKFKINEIERLRTYNREILRRNT